MEREPIQREQIIAQWQDIATRGDSRSLCILTEKLHFQSEARYPEIVLDLIKRIVNEDEAILLMDLEHRVCLQQFLDRHSTESMFAYMSFLSGERGASSYQMALCALTQMALRVGLPNDNGMATLVYALREARESGAGFTVSDDTIDALAEKIDWKRIRLEGQIMTYDCSGRLREIYDEHTSDRTELIYNGMHEIESVTGRSCINLRAFGHDPFNHLDFGPSGFRPSDEK